MLEIENLVTGYGDVKVLDEVSLTVDDGETVSLLGANGAGKTTLLMSISQIVPPWKGSIRLRGEDLTSLRPDEVVERGLVHVPEGRRAFPDMSVLENLLMGGHNKRARPQRDRVLEDVLELFPRLAERRWQKAGTLSGGEQQMLAIGRGLMAQPSLLMLDEPSWGLAPSLIDIVFDTIRNVKKTGVAILLVEQSVAGALELSSRGYVMESGRIAVSGTSDHLASTDEVRRAYLGG